MNNPAALDLPPSPERNYLQLKETLIKIACQYIGESDSSHDFLHAMRVLGLAEKLALSVDADLEIVLPAALFHDSIIYPKNDPDSPYAALHSSELAGKVLCDLDEFPEEKIEEVKYAIAVCSFSKNITKKTKEAIVVQDADLLESTGALAIMRTFGSGGQLKIPFYNPDDPFCESREPLPLDYSLDLVFSRLLKVKERLITPLAIELAVKRERFLRLFIKQLKAELADTESF